MTASRSCQPWDNGEEISVFIIYLLNKILSQVVIIRYSFLSKKKLILSVGKCSVITSLIKGTYIE